MPDQVNMTTFFSKKAAADDDGEQTHKRALPKPDRAYFWTGFLNLIAGTLGSNPRFKCISCKHEMNGVQRAAMHLKAEPPEEKLVQLCPNVTEEQAADCRRLYGQKKYKTGATQPEVVSPKPGIRAKTYITGPLKAIADRLFARFIFMSMLPFRLVDKVWFKEFISDGLHVLYKFPDRARLSGELLDAEAARVQKRVDDLLALEDFVELCGDGWSNIRGESIVSYVATCSKGDYYLWSTDASLVDKKDAAWCFADFKRVVKLSKLPYSRLSGFISDTENKMRALWKLIEAEFPEIFAYGCCTHTLQLILKSVCALEWFGMVCAKCNQIAKWFRNHHLPAGLLKKYCTLLKLSVERPVRNCATRFASWVYVVERIRQLKPALRAAIDDDVYKQRCLKKSGNADDPEDKEPSAIIDDASFWLQTDKFLEVLVPVRVFLRYTDTRFSLACRVYEGFSNLQRKVENLELGAGFDGDVQSQVVTIITERWDAVHHPVHAAGYMLDPSNIKVDVSGNKELNDGFAEVLRRLLTKDEAKQAEIEFMKYKDLDGFTPEILDLVDDVKPAAFWRSKCGHLPVLQKKIVPRVIQLRAGTRCVESHFSVMGAIHSKARPRLINSKVRKLTAIVTNEKMLNAAARPGFADDEMKKAVESDSESDYASDTDEEVDTNLKSLEG